MVFGICWRVRMNFAQRVAASLALNSVILPIIHRTNATTSFERLSTGNGRLVQRGRRRAAIRVGVGVGFGQID